MRRFLIFFVLGFVSVLTPALAAAEDDVFWRDEWSKFRTVQGVYTVGALGAAVSVELFWQELQEPNWRGPIFIDDAIRNLMLPESDEGITSADLWSDITVLTALFYPFADAIWAGGFVHKDPEVTGQMLLMNMQSYATSLLVVGVSKRLIGRERPGVGGCYDDPNFSEECKLRSTKSHPSGHTSTAFTGAGLTCAHHANLPLYGGGAADIAACGAAMAVATATGLLRISANAHYLSDVVVGALIGFGAGFLMPTLLHYSGESTEAELETSQQAQAPVILHFGGAF